uniref:Uncharacterized protein n=2 Tax=Esox lucius TaxID=8010 RepID=A0AAY5KAG6_ESOLU
MTKTAALAAMDFCSMWLPDIRMSKPVEVENTGADSPMESTDSERNGSESNHQVQQMKISPFPISPTFSSNKKSRLIRPGNFLP